METILIFSGTTEGRELAKRLAGAGIPAVVCVATEYGKQVMSPLPGIIVHEGRMNQEEMQGFMEQETFSAVVDATHPFATEVSENIRAVVKESGIPYLRLQRNTFSNGKHQVIFTTNEECAEALLQTHGNILLTTGSKELAVYCRSKELRERLCVRVLPSTESITVCQAQGLSGKQIIAMQGPFSAEMNMAILKQYDIRIMVTKESGMQGGFEEKAAAAEQMGIPLYVIGNPEQEPGLSFENVCSEIEKITGTILTDRNPLSVSLIGIGPGGYDTLTIGAKEKIEKADMIFGAERLISCVREWGFSGNPQMFPYYTAEDIIPILEKERESEKREAVILFSGDCGFYSGASILFQKLKTMEQSGAIKVQIYPGISSVSCFAAKLGISWQDSEILSIHGKGERENWESEVLSAIRYHTKVFLLVSGAADVRALGSVILENKIAGCRIMVGYQLSYPEERICSCTPQQCMNITEEGLYIIAILREECEQRILSPYIPDSALIRGNVPMTKEEIREIIVCKLHLTKDSIVYDIGSGTGSIAIEIAKRSESIRVYAVERTEEGIGLIQENKKKFQLPNIEIVPGTAPDCLTNLPIPTHAFIGGSGGAFKEILKELYRKNPKMHIVITAVSLETITELTEVLDSMPVTDMDMIQVQISRARQVGKHHLMQAENPVYICSFIFGKL